MVGAEVHTKAIHITNYAECSRLFGTMASSKWVRGTVKNVVVVVKNGRRLTRLMVVWELSSKIVEKELSLGTVKAGPPPALPATSQGSDTPPSSGLTLGSTVTEAGHSGSRAPCMSSRPPPVHESQASVSPAGSAGPAEARAPATLPRSPETGAQPAPSAAAHGYTWTRKDVNEPVGGPVPRQAWSVRTFPGEVIFEGGDTIGTGSARSPYDYFLAMFPMEQLVRMVRLTTAQLLKRGLPATTAGELLKLMGVMLLATRFEFGARADLWATQARSKYMPVPALGQRTGMPRARFDSLWSCLTFSEAPGGNGDMSEEARWGRIDDFVSAINAHRAAHVSPSEVICVDESISKWYGMGGHWISRGLPMYVAIDRKPENGCEIQNAACGRSGIMLKLNVVTTAEHQRAHPVEGEDDLGHGTAILKRLVSPWASSRRIVCADSYFASVEAAEVLRRMGLRFIGVVKTATRGYPMAELGAIEMPARGDHVSYVHTSAEGEVALMAVMWVDRERRYFIASASSAAPGTPCNRVRWRQGESRSERVAFSVPQPLVAQVYYASCAQIDHHNRCRQDDLRLEHKLGTHDWAMRVNLTLLGMCIVDSWLLYAGARGGTAGLTQKQFYEDLAAQLIDNTFDRVGVRDRGAPAQTAATADLPPFQGVGIHLTPTTKRRAGDSSKDRDYRAQRACRACKRYGTSHVCSGCRMGGKGEFFFVVPSWVGRALLIM